MIETKQQGFSYRKIIWRQFKINRPAYYSLWLIGFLVFIAAGADLIAGDKPYYMKYKGKHYFPVFRQYAVNLGLTEWPSELKRRRNLKKLKVDIAIYPPIPYGPGEIRLAE